jgi:hypothetical protein
MNEIQIDNIQIYYKINIKMSYFVIFISAHVMYS